MAVRVDGAGGDAVDRKDKPALLPPHPMSPLAATARCIALPPLGEVKVPVGDGYVCLWRVADAASSVTANPATRGSCDLWAYVWTSSHVAATLTVAAIARWRHAARCDGVAAGGDVLTPAAHHPRVLEVGCGTGLAALAAAVLAGATVTATDVAPAALQLVQHNAEANGASHAVTTAVMDWHAVPPTTGALPHAPASRGWPWDGAPSPFHFVVGADVLFVSSCVRPVLNTLARALGVDGAPTGDDSGRAHGAGADSLGDAAGASCRGFGTGRWRNPCAGILVDPGRFARDDVEALAPDHGLHVYLREDVAGVVTPWARMKECTVFVLSIPPPSLAAPPSPHATTPTESGRDDGSMGASDVFGAVEEAAWPPRMSPLAAAVTAVQEWAAGQRLAVSNVHDAASCTPLGYVMPAMPPTVKR